LKFSIGHRLFAAVLLAIVTVTASGIALMRHHLMASFSSYAVQIELDRLQQLSQSLAKEHQRSGGWRFLPTEPNAQRSFISNELLRLQGWPQVPEPPSAPELPSLPGPTVAYQQHALPPFASSAKTPEPPLLASSAKMPAPPAPPADLPPLPPLPPPPVFVRYAAGPAPDLEMLSLQDRITLSDTAGRYLAGRPTDGAASARRPITLDGRTVGYLSVAQVSRPSDAMSSAFLDRIRDSLLLIAAVSVALSALAATLLARHFRAPIEQLAKGASALADGRYDTRIDVVRSDELGQLAQHFNQMADKLGQMEATRRQWVADSSHELRTPLSVLRAQLEAIQDGVRQADADSVAAMLRQVLSLNKLIDELYALAQSDTGQLAYQFDTFNVWDLLTETADSFRARLHSAGLTLTLSPAPAQTLVEADRERVRQVFANLFENCIRYTEAPGSVELSADSQPGRLLIFIDDSAPGVPAEALSRLGERFYRVDGSRSRAHGGAGLGLALCQRIIEAHGGEIGFSHTALGGLRVTIALPRARA
jgi:two-component system sensor histidine kinase BaeS